ncbi:MAG: protein-export chaperone SecB [Gammaproteobacteria bacterium]|nr:MAG: protein-export chaperone SecB [Gammaproteobacteria bacterium]
MADNAEFGLERLYLKDASFESPRSPDVFAEAWKPEVQLDISSRTRGLPDDRYEVVLTVTVHARNGEGNTSLIIEVQQAGIFKVAGLPPDKLKRVTATVCPNLLFPYVRETVDNMAVRGGFPALMLAPVNFELLFDEALKQQANRDAAASKDATEPAEEPPVQH